MAATFSDNPSISTDNCGGTGKGLLLSYDFCLRLLPGGSLLDNWLSFPKQVQEYPVSSECIC